VPAYNSATGLADRIAEGEYTRQKMIKLLTQLARIKSILHFHAKFDQIGSRTRDAASDGKSTIGPLVCPENNLARGRNFDTGTGCANGPFTSAFSYWSYLMRIGMEKLESDTALSKNLGSFQFLQKSRKRNVCIRRILRHRSMRHIRHSTRVCEKQGDGGEGFIIEQG
jgi:hypothetical protein